MLFRKLIGLVALLGLAGYVFAAESQTGPVIESYGPVYDVPAGSWNLKQDTHYKVSMDVSATADFSGDLNRRLESAARFTLSKWPESSDPLEMARKSRDPL